MKEKDISVAIKYPAPNRFWVVKEPLETTKMQVDINPRNPYKYDILYVGTPNAYLGIEGLINKFTRSKLIYRIRGNLLQVMEDQNWAKWHKKGGYFALSLVDGAIAFDPYMANVFREKTDINNIGIGKLWIDPDKYPSTDHTKNLIVALTLTNANYERKIWPILEWAPIVNKYIKGDWLIYGKGKYSDLLEKGLKPYSNVQFMGYTNNPKEKLAWANVMFHPSDLDGLCNAMIEGLASDLPIVTNEHTAFTNSKAPLLVTNKHKLPNVLKSLKYPVTREIHSVDNRKYLEKNHNKRIVGQQYVEYFKDVLE